VHAPPAFTQDGVTGAEQVRVGALDVASVHGDGREASCTLVLFGRAPQVVDLLSRRLSAAAGDVRSEDCAAPIRRPASGIATVPR
jgi:hypothetical protein